MAYDRAERLLFIGSLPPPIGGTTVSLAALIAFARADGREVRVVDTVRSQGGPARQAVGAVFGLLAALRWCDVVTMHFSDRATLTIAPILSLICRVAGRPFIFRQFGGSLESRVARSPSVAQWIVRRTVFSADAVLLQTKAMVQSFAAWSRRIHWFPTARPRPGVICAQAFANGKREELRCIFVGHVSRLKGVDLAARVISKTEGASLSVYGPLVDLTEADFTSDQVVYRGIAPANEIARVMEDHDLLLFPTCYPGEGYSGTLVEAAQVAIPMLVSRWQALPEMFREDEVVFLPPADEDAWTKSLKELRDNPRTMLGMSAKLLARSADFDADKVFGEFLRICDSLVAQRGRG